MLVSTGMCTLSEIDAAVDTILATGNQELVLLHCVVSYPSRPEDANLRVIETLQRAFGLPVGLSDHTQDEFTSILATQMGAVVIEKHYGAEMATSRKKIIVFRCRHPRRYGDYRPTYCYPSPISRYSSTSPAADLGADCENVYPDGDVNPVGYVLGGCSGDHYLHSPAGFRTLPRLLSTPADVAAFHPAG
jgi:hypothetical protein